MDVIPEECFVPFFLNRLPERRLCVGSAKQKKKKTKRKKNRIDYNLMYVRNFLSAQICSRGCILKTQYVFAKSSMKGGKKVMATATETKTNNLNFPRI